MKFIKTNFKMKLVPILFVDGDWDIVIKFNCMVLTQTEIV